MWLWIIGLVLLFLFPKQVFQGALLIVAMLVIGSCLILIIEPLL